MAVLGVIGLQWDGYLVLTLWALDVAIVWAAGFVYRQDAARIEAILLWGGLRWWQSSGSGLAMGLAVIGVGVATVSIDRVADRRRQG